MNLPNNSHSKIYFIWVAMLALAICAAPAHGAVTANPSAVTFSYLTGQSFPASQTVTALNNGTQATITAVSISVPQPATLTAGNGTTQSTAGIFTYFNQGTGVVVGLDATTLNRLFNAVGTITATMNLTVTGSATPVAVPLTLSLGSSGTNSSITATPSTLTFQAQVGVSPNAQALQINSSTGITTTFTATATIVSGGINWLTVSPTGIQLSTPAQLLVQASAGLSQGTYSGYINITPTGGTTSQVLVTFQVGTGGGGTGLVATPTFLNFATATNTAVPAAQSVSLQTFTGAVTYQFNAISSGNWLTVNNTTFGQGTFFNTQAQLTVQVNPLSLSTGSYTGTITVYDSLNSQQTISVTLTVGSGTSGGLTLSPSNISFVTSTVNINPASQGISISSTTAGVNYTAFVSSGSWLSLSGATTGTLPNNGTLIASANVLGLGSGTYSGQITISTSGNLVTTAYIPVLLTIGGTGTGGVGAIAPASLAFSGQAGSTNIPGAQWLVVTGSGAYSATASITSGTGTWLQIASQGSGSAPGALSIAVAPAGLAAGTYTGNIAVTVSGFTTNVPVTLTLTSGGNIISTPGSAFTNAYPSYPAPSQTLFLNMSDGTTNVPYTVTSSQSWATVSTTGQTLPATVQVIFNAELPTSGLNSAVLTVSVAGAANNPLSIPIIVNNQSGSSSGGALTLSPSSVTFTGAVGGAIAQQTVSLNSTTLVNYTAAVSPISGGNWLTVSPTSGTAPSTITLFVNSSGLSAGTYSANVILTANNSQQTLPVSLVIGGSTSSTLILTPTSLTFSYTAGGAAPASQNISVASALGTSVVFSVSASTNSGGNWLQVTGGGATTGTGSINTTVSILPNVLTAAGTYTGTVTFQPQSGTAQTVPVTVTVTAPASISVGTTSLSFTYRAGDQAPASQSVQVTATNSTTPLSFTSSVTSGSTWLSVTPASGQTPGTVVASVTPGSLDPGSYTGTIAINGANGAAGSGTVTVTITVTAPLPTISRVVNAASYAGGALSPGEFVAISGTAIGPNETQSGGVDGTTGRWQTTLGGVQVLFNGIPAPIVYVSATQVSAIVPYEVAGRFDAAVQVRFRGSTSNAITMPVTSTLPGIFTQNASGTGPGAILNQNGTVNGPSNPANKGDVIVIYATGEGIVQSLSGTRPVTGTIIPVTIQLNNIPRPLLPVAVLIGGQPADLYGNFAGSAPGYVVGVLQINAVIPANLSASGSVPIVIAVGSNTSQTGVTVSVR